MRIAVLDIGGTSIKSGIYEKNALSGIKETPTNAYRGGEAVMKTAREVLRLYAPFDSIGVSTAGQVDADKGVIRYANSNIPGYTGMNVKRILEREFGVPVAVENDVNTAALGEGIFGAGAGEKDFLCITYGTGVGGAVVSDGKLWRGSCFSAGEMQRRICSADAMNGTHLSQLLWQRPRRGSPSLTAGEKFLRGLQRNLCADLWMTGYGRLSGDLFP